MSEVKSILLVGVGGQGAILTAKVLVNGLMRAGYDVKMSEVHGMSQQGGSVSTQVRWGGRCILPSSATVGRIIWWPLKDGGGTLRQLPEAQGVAVINDYGSPRLPSPPVSSSICRMPGGHAGTPSRSFP